MELVAVGNRVVVEKVEEEEDGGLIIRSKGLGLNVMKGVILSASGTHETPVPLSGEIIYFRKDDSIPIHGKHIIHIDHILCKET